MNAIILIYTQENIGLLFKLNYWTFEASTTWYLNVYSTFGFGTTFPSSGFNSRSTRTLKKQEPSPRDEDVVFGWSTSTDSLKIPNQGLAPSQTEVYVANKGGDVHLEQVWLRRIPSLESSFLGLEGHI
ncbi:hypothetical protein JOB18_012088 [Solea senegalensis]|uniref:Uncharacterized protein n=1 Tax=Solea senegalensis TaxID=28829 RepID=A0AAV6PIK4_SOLSE|nr:hypothetical protein JOB18_012088 [Solea senegalensis]